VIAFATVLNRENYALKRLLPKFIIAAVLINFSKLICGVIIDFAQVIMLTFVNGFRDIGGGNLANMLGLTKLLSISPSLDPSQEVSTLTIVGTYILALLYTIVATVVIGIIMMVLIIRMIMIWIYVVLSPLPYLLSVLPATEKYASKWWTEFTNNVVSGPILAFFIWLSFASVQPNATGPSLLGNAPQPNSGDQEKVRLKNFESSGAPIAGISEAGSADNMLKFIISIGLLMGGLMITKELGGLAGDLAGSAVSKIKSAPGKLSRLAARPVTDRLSAFNKQRQGVRQAKIEAFGDRAFARYQSGKGAVAGTVKGGLAAARGVPGDVTRWAGNRLAASESGLLRKTGKGIQGFQQGMADYRIRKQQEKATRVKAKADSLDLRDRRQHAYTTGVFKDKNGKEFDQQIQYTDPNGKTFTHYTREKKDANGNLVKDPLGNQIYEIAKENGKDVEKMSQAEFGALNAWNKSMETAKSYRNTKEEERIGKEQKKMDDAGMSVGQLAAMLQDTSIANEKREAAALALAVKEGFKNRSEVQQAQTLLKGTGNSVLKKKFDETIDKKQAHLNYNLEDEAERKKFAKRYQDGKFDVLNADAYKDKNVIQAMSDSLTKDEFVNYAKKVSARSSTHDLTQKEGLKLYLNEQKPAFDHNNELDKSRLVVGKVTGDMNDAVRGHGQDLETMTKILTDAFERMPTADAVKLKLDTFTPNKRMYEKADEQAKYEENYKTALKAAFTSAFNGNDVKNMMNNRNADKKVKNAIQDLAGGKLQTIGSQTNQEEDEEEEENNQT